MQLQFIFILSEFLKSGQSNPQRVPQVTTFFCRKESSVLVTPCVYISQNSQVIHTDRKSRNAVEQTFVNSYGKRQGENCRSRAQRGSGSSWNLDEQGKVRQDSEYSAFTDLVQLSVLKETIDNGRHQQHNNTLIATCLGTKDFGFKFLDTCASSRAASFSSFSDRARSLTQICQPRKNVHLNIFLSGSIVLGKRQS